MILWLCFSPTLPYSCWRGNFDKSKYRIWEISKRHQRSSKKKCCSYYTFTDEMGRKVENWRSIININNRKEVGVLTLFSKNRQGQLWLCKGGPESSQSEGVSVTAGQWGCVSLRMRSRVANGKASLSESSQWGRVSLRMRPSRPSSWWPGSSILPRGSKSPFHTSPLVKIKSYLKQML